MSNIGSLPDYSNNLNQLTQGNSVKDPWPLVTNPKPSVKWVPKTHLSETELKTTSLWQKFTNTVKQAVQNLISLPIIPAFYMKVNEPQLSGGHSRNASVYKPIYIPVKDSTYMKIIVACQPTDESAQRKRFTLYTPGNAEIVSGDYRSLDSITQISKNLDANSVTLDYRFYNEKQEQIFTGINRDLVLKAHGLALQFIEEEMEASEVVLIGRSLGGGIQAESLAKHDRKADVKYVTVSIDTFGELKELVKSLFGGNWFGRLAGNIVDYFEWNLRTAECSNKTEVPHVIIQSTLAARITYEKDAFTQNVVKDGIITPEAAHAPAMAKRGAKNVHYFGIPFRQHNDPLYLNVWGVTDKIKEILSATS